MGKGKRTLSTVKSLKCNYRLKEEVKIEKLLISIKKMYKYTKLYCLPICYFFSLSGAFLKSFLATSNRLEKKIEHFQMPQIVPESQIITKILNSTQGSGM